MRSHRLHSILLSLVAAILITIIAGCGGMSGNSPSNPASPGGNPGGGNGGGGGGSPQSSTFVYVQNGRFHGNLFVFKLNSDGTLTSMSNAPVSDPQSLLG